MRVSEPVHPLLADRPEYLSLIRLGPSHLGAALRSPARPAPLGRQSGTRARPPRPAIAPGAISSARRHGRVIQQGRGAGRVGAPPTSLSARPPLTRPRLVALPAARSVGPQPWIWRGRRAAGALCRGRRLGRRGCGPVGHFSGGASGERDQSDRGGGDAGDDQNCHRASSPRQAEEADGSLVVEDAVLEHVPTDQCVDS